MTESLARARVSEIHFEEEKSVSTNALGNRGAGQGGPSMDLVPHEGAQGGVWAVLRTLNPEKGQGGSLTGTWKWGAGGRTGRTAGITVVT